MQCPQGTTLQFASLTGIQEFYHSGESDGCKTTVDNINNSLTCTYQAQPFEGAIPSRLCTVEGAGFCATTNPIDPTSGNATPDPIVSNIQTIHCSNTACGATTITTDPTGGDVGKLSTIECPNYAFHITGDLKTRQAISYAYLNPTTVANPDIFQTTDPITNLCPPGFKLLAYGLTGVGQVTTGAESCGTSVTKYTNPNDGREGISCDIDPATLPAPVDGTSPITVTQTANPTQIVCSMRGVGYCLPAEDMPPEIDPTTGSPKLDTNNQPIPRTSVPTIGCQNYVTGSNEGQRKIYSGKLYNKTPVPKGGSGISCPKWTSMHIVSLNNHFSYHGGTDNNAIYTIANPVAMLLDTDGNPQLGTTSHIEYVPYPTISRWGPLLQYCTPPDPKSPPGTPPTCIGVPNSVDCAVGTYSGAKGGAISALGFCW